MLFSLLFLLLVLWGSLKIIIGIPFFSNKDEKNSVPCVVLNTSAQFIVKMILLFKKKSTLIIA